MPLQLFSLSSKLNLQASRLDSHSIHPVHHTLVDAGSERFDLWKQPCKCSSEHRL